MDFQALWHRDLFYGNTVGHLATFVGALALTLVLAKVVQVAFKGWLARLASRSATQIDDVFLRVAERPVYWIVLAVGLDVSIEALALPARVAQFAGDASTVVGTVMVAWALSRLVTDLRRTYFDAWAAKSESRLDDHIIVIFERLAKVVIWVLAILAVVSNLGYDIMSILTGLGLGGLALAMAAKDTLSNVFGSVTILADRPFQVGDVVTLAGHTGTVEDVGLRTCRVRTFEGTLITVPNANLVGGVIENLSARPARRFLNTLGLTYDTTHEELEAAIQAIKDMLAAHPKVRDDFAVRFMNYGPSSLDIQVIYWVVPAADYPDVVGELNLAIKERFDAEGWSFAFPSMTIYRGDAPVSAESHRN